MPSLIISLFALAAILGIFLLVCLVRNKPVSKYIPILHGVLAGAGLIALIFYAVSHPSVLTSLILFASAALGGLYMLFTFRSGKKPPKLVPFVHGSLAIIALILLIYSIF